MNDIQILGIIASIIAVFTYPLAYACVALMLMCLQCRDHRDAASLTSDTEAPAKFVPKGRRPAGDDRALAMQRRPRA